MDLLCNLFLSPPQNLQFTAEKVDILQQDKRTNQNNQPLCRKYWYYIGIWLPPFELCSSVSSAAEEEARGGTQCFAEGGGGIAHHAGQL